MIMSSLPRQADGPDITDPQPQLPVSTSNVGVASAHPPCLPTNTRKQGQIDGDGDKDGDGDGEINVDSDLENVKVKGKPRPKRSTTRTEGDEEGMIDGRPRDVYDRFTRAQKVRMTAIVSFSALLSRRSLPFHLLSMSLVLNSGEWKLESEGEDGETGSDSADFCSNGLINLPTLCPPTGR